MRYEAYLGSSKKEIEDFYIGGRQVEELWAGNTLLWKKGNIIKENVADFCGFEKIVSENGTEALSVDYVRGVTDVSGGKYFELFIGDAPYAKRLLEHNFDVGESWHAVCFERYFYAARLKSVSYMESRYVIQSFCKYDEDGNVVYQYENAGEFPIDKIKELSSPHGHYHYLSGLAGFYVINDTFYFAFRVSNTDGSNCDNDDTYLLVSYKGGAYMSQKLISGVKLVDEDNNEGNSSCKNQFMINGQMILAGNRTPGPDYRNRPLIVVSESGFSRPFSKKYSYIGTNGKNIFLTNTNANFNNRTEIYLLNSGEYELIYDIKNDGIYYDITCLEFIGDMMYIAANYGSAGYPDHAIVIEVNLNSPKKGTVIYRLNTPKRKYSWIAIRLLTTKNGKLYVHKEWQKLWTDGNNSMLGVDEITFLRKKKGETT